MNLSVVKTKLLHLVGWQQVDYLIFYGYIYTSRYTCTQFGIIKACLHYTLNASTLNFNETNVN